MSPSYDLSVILLHEHMLNKQGDEVTTSITLNDIQDLARTTRTYGVKNLFIAHPSVSLRRLARRLQIHWEQGFGSTYNPKRKEAFTIVKLVKNLDEAIFQTDLRCSKLPKLVATSARPGSDRIGYSEFSKELKQNNQPYLLMLGTGWGMSTELMKRADCVLDPIQAQSDFNHLSVRSACAIMLDRIVTSSE